MPSFWNTAWRGFLGATIFVAVSSARAEVSPVSSGAPLDVSDPRWERVWTEGDGLGPYDWPLSSIPHRGPPGVAFDPYPGRMVRHIAGRDRARIEQRIEELLQRLALPGDPFQYEVTLESSLFPNASIDAT